MVAKEAILCNTKKNKPMEKKISAEESLAKNSKDNMSSIFTKQLFIILIIFIFLGGITGYAANSMKSNTGNTLISGSVDPDKVSKGTIVGSNDTKTFKDTALGTLKNGGINGEGQFHLVRPGGDSQNVYLTSSTVDLGKYTGRKLKVWGQTQKAQHAGWLMDVGKIEVLE